MNIDSESYEILGGHIAALDMLMRGLYAEKAAKAPEPIASMRRMITGIIVSMHQVDSPKTEAESRVWHFAEEALREFGRNVAIRLEGEGYKE